MEQSSPGGLDASRGEPPLASIVIPAHNEGANIDRCLKALMPLDDVEIVVICNGCTDDSFERVRAFPSVRAIAIPVASKVAALNAGDAATSVMPRIYLDADVQITPASVRAVVGALRSGADAAAPLAVIDTGDSSWAVRAYYAVWKRLGYITRNALGSGFYGFSQAGRSRFGAFPDLVSDDGFVYSLFTPAERINPPDARFTITAPRTLAGLLRRRIRIIYGTKQLARQGWVMDVPRPYWFDLVRRQPSLLFPAVLFVLVNILADRAATKRIRAGHSAWSRDDSREHLQMAGRRRGLRGAVRTLASGRTYRHYLRLINFFGYDVAEQSQMHVGADVRLSPTVSVRNGARVRLGSGVHVGQNCYLWAGDSSGRIEVGDYALLGPDVMVTASNYDFDHGPGPVMDLPKKEADIRIGANTWLGTRVTVVAGVTIGDGTIVAAGSVVTRDLPPNVVAAGVPARVLRKRGSDE